jgi:uncharacterized protein with FMN-binding domain
MASKQTILAVSAVGLLVLIGAGVVLFTSTQKDTAGSSTSSSSTSISSSLSSTSSSTSSLSTTSISTATAATVYRDGTYKASGSYTSPGGNESVEVTITLKDDLITSVSTSTDSKERQSRQYLGLFSQGISGQVNGKTLDNANVSGNVNGSSLTGRGFNQALKNIADQARN